MSTDYNGLSRTGLVDEAYSFTPEEEVAISVNLQNPRMSAFYPASQDVAIRRNRVAGLSLS